MSDTTTVEPPVETSPLLRRATDPKPRIVPPPIPMNVAPAAPRTGFSFMQVAVLIGIAVFVNGVFLLFVSQRNSAPAASVPVVAPAPVHSAPVVPVVSAPVAPAPAPVQPAPVVAAAAPAPIAETPAPKPAVRSEVSQPEAVVPHHVRHRPVVAAKPAATPAEVPAPAPAPAPVALTAPNIDSVQYDGPIIHMAWKSLGKDVTYKVYVSPNLQQPSFEFRFNKYGPSMDWFLNENKTWRYVAITVVDKSGKESTLSNTIDTTPSLPKPEY